MGRKDAAIGIAEARNVEAIKKRFAESQEWAKKHRSNKRLVEVLADLEDDDDDGPRACLICQL